MDKNTSDAAWQIYNAMHTAADNWYSINASGLDGVEWELDKMVAIYHVSKDYGKGTDDPLTYVKNLCLHTPQEGELIHKYHPAVAQLYNFLITRFDLQSKEV